MSQGGYLAIGISVIVILLVVFIVSFVLYVRTPVPKGCEKINDEACAKCGHKHVPTYKAVFLAMHMGRTRHLRCPKCGEKSWQKKVL